MPPLVQALRDVREILYRARRKDGDVRELETAIERINRALDKETPASGSHRPDAHS